MQLPAGLAGKQSDLLAEAVAALDEVHVCHDVGGDLPEPLRVQHGSSDANEEDDDLQGSKACREHHTWWIKFLPQPLLHARFAAIWMLTGFF